jgi:ABC-2 type transport system permease protein
MNSPSNFTPQSSVNAQPVTSVPESRQLYWCIRRELWEYRSIYVAPLAVAGVYLLGFLMYLHKLPDAVRGAMQYSPERPHQDLLPPFDFAAAAIMGTAFLVGMLYCLDSLHAERRDRSILFWKSLPLSDLTTVLGKACIPLLVLPMICWTLTLALQGVMLLLSTVVLSANGISPTNLWNQVGFFKSGFLLFYHLFTVHVLWYAPIYAFLMLVSAWARRTPLLWAVLPITALSIFEHAVFHTSYLAHSVLGRFGGGPEMDPTTMSGGFPFHGGLHITPFHFLMSPGLWIGLLVAAAFLVAAARIRRNREPE